MRYKYTGVLNLHTKCDIQLFDAHNRKFIFIYERKSPLPCNSFIYIAFLGTMKEANRFCYELEFFKPGEEVISLKYRLICVPDFIKPVNVALKHQCVFLCSNSLKHFIVGDNLHFRFWIKQVRDVLDAKTNKK